MGVGSKLVEIKAVHVHRGFHHFCFFGFIFYFRNLYWFLSQSNRDHLVFVITWIEINFFFWLYRRRWRRDLLTVLCPFLIFFIIVCSCHERINKQNIVVWHLQQNFWTGEPSILLHLADGVSIFNSWPQLLLKWISEVPDIIKLHHSFTKAESHLWQLLLTKVLLLFVFLLPLPLGKF